MKVKRVVWLNREVVEGEHAAVGAFISQEAADLADDAVLLVVVSRNRGDVDEVGAAFGGIQNGWLSQEQADALPDRTEIEVTWSGGNGPHRYRVHVDEHGRRYAWSGSGIPTYNPLEFVGREPFHTHVAIVDEAAMRVERIDGVKILGRRRSDGSYDVRQDPNA